jgi:putative ABC transport system ATP-binding protein
MTAVELVSVSRTYESEGGTVWAVREVTHSFHKGHLVGVYGVSGSGKSTLLNLISGLDTPTSGQVRLDGEDIGVHSEDVRAELRLRRVGVVFQEHNLLEEFSAIENVMLPLEVTGLATKAAREVAAAYLERVGLSGLEIRHPSEMSGGQRQRVGIARALVGGRDVLVADEPSGALDSQTSRSVFELLRSVADEGRTVIVATHDPLVREYADEVTEIVDGSLRVLHSSTSLS